MYAFAIDSKPPLPFPADVFIVGSGPEAAMRFEARLVAPSHAQIRVSSEGHVVVRDLTGRQLVWIDEVPVTEARLVEGARLRLGRLTLVLVASDTTAPERAPPEPRGNLAATLISASAVASPPPRRPGLDPGTVVAGRFRVLSFLAEGGMGTVYRAEHVALGKRFALKVIKPELSGDPLFAQRFKREALALGRIGHPNIVDISDFGETEDGRFYFAMELVEGPTLGTVLKREGALATPRAVELALQVAHAVAAAHAVGVIHRDLKPDNIMILSRPGLPEAVKVLDFGVAKVVAPGQLESGSGLMMGTPRYMAPEQTRGEAVDGRSDLYSLGLIIYELLTGRPAFDADSTATILMKQAFEKPIPFPPEVAAVVPPLLASLVFQLLAKDRGARPQTMEPVIGTLRAVKSELAQASTHRAAPAVSDTMLAAPTLRVTGPGPEVTLATPVPLARLRPAPAEITQPGPVAPQTLPLRVPTEITEPFGKLPKASPVAARVEPVDGTSTVTAVPPPRSSRRPVVAVMGVLVALAIAGALIGTARTTAAARDGDGTQPPAPRLTTVRLETVPAGAEVNEGGVTLGATPLELRRAPGAILELSFIAPQGYRDDVQRVTVPEDESTIVIHLGKVGGDGTDLVPLRPARRGPTGPAGE